MSTAQIKIESNDQEREQLLLNQQIQDYISSLSEREKLVMEIAREHLQSSFCIERSVGFIKWVNANKEKYLK